MKHIVKVIKAFSIDGTGGNPAGVVFDADELSSNTRQLIAARAGFSETAFVSKSSIADFKLDFYTPVKQIPHCGHATIGTFSYLRKAGKIKSDDSSKETIDGIRKIRFINNLPFMEQMAPAFIVPENQLDILESLNISREDLYPDLTSTVVNTGNSFLMVPVKDEETLARISYDHKLVSAISEQYGLIGFYPFAFTNERPFIATTRMFGPAYGIEEEAATGMAAGPLACYLFKNGFIKEASVQIQQGKFMIPPSVSSIQVQLNVEDDRITGLYAGGDAYVAGEVVVDL